MEDAHVAVLLVRRCIAGDAAAWEEIVQVNSRRIYNICYRFTGSASDADDLTQEVFIKIYRTLSSYDVNLGAFMTWVTTVTRNLLVDHFRKAGGDLAFVHLTDRVQKIFKVVGFYRLLTILQVKTRRWPTLARPSPPCTSSC